MLVVNNTLEIAAREHKSGNLQHAKQLYEKVLEKFPGHYFSFFSLGVIEHQRGNSDTAIKLIENAIEINPEIPQYYNTLGIIYETINKYDEAICAYQKAILKEPDYAEAYLNIAIALKSQKKYIEAIENCRNSISITPCYAEAYNTLAFLLEKQKKYDEAIENYKKAIKIKPDYVEAYNHLGDIYNELGDYQEAAKSFYTAMQYDPSYAELYNNLGIAQKELEQFDDAISNFKQAIKLEKNFAEAYYNLANSLRDEGDCNEAVKNYKKAIDINPDYAHAHWNLSLAQLLDGNYLEGWKGYKWRRNADLKVLTDYHKTGKPRWDGSSFKSKILFMHYEQGLGDNIQFVRYLPMVKSRGGKVIFETLKPLIGLLNNFPGVDEIIEYNPDEKSSIQFDYYASLLDMPYIFETTVETIPSDVPYIYADPVKSRYWSERISKDKFNVGIVWAGSPEHGNDRYRSCKLQSFSSLSMIEGVCLYGLQKGKAAEQMAELTGQIPVINISDDFEDFTDTAAAIDNLDLVISVDTSVLHLAGAMGKKVWALLPFSPEWRWMLNREDSPWYPTMKLFRQKKRNDWYGLFKQVCEELKMLVQNK